MELLYGKRFSKDLDAIRGTEKNEFDELYEQADLIQRKISNLIKYLRSTTQQTPQTR